MRRRVLTVGLAAAWLMLAAVVPTQAQSLRDLVPFGRTHRIAQLLQSVVNIAAHKMTSDPGDGSAPRREETYGSGFIIDPSGLILTNRHVIEGALDITVILSDGTALPAKLRGVAGTIDIALLEVSPAKPLPKIAWGDSDKVRVGDQVLAMGNPLGIGESVSAGIVSAKNREVLGTPFDDFIQTDAAINHGNSGGPLFDTRGNVIGVNTALITPSDKSGSVGLGFAIPANDARVAAEQLRRFGKLMQGWIGMRAQDVTPGIADALGLKLAIGAIVARVDPDGPAAAAGLQVGDIVQRFDRVVPSDARALARLVAALPAGSLVEMQVRRDRKDVTLSLTVAAPPDMGGASAAPAKATRIDAPDLGLATAPLTGATRAAYNLAPSLQGVVITGVAAHTAAEESGLAEGDVILRVQQDAVSTPADIQSRIDAARAASRRHVLLLVQGHAGLRWIALVVGKPPADRGSE